MVQSLMCIASKLKCIVLIISVLQDDKTEF